MKREIAELEAQMAQTMPADKHKRGGSAGYGIVLVDVAALSPNMQLMVCSGSVLVLYLLFGLCQEFLVKVKYGDTKGWYITFIQFSYYTSFALAQRRSPPDAGEGADSVRGAGFIADTLRPWRRTVPLSNYIVLGVLQAMCVGLSNVSLQHLTYPTHTLLKASKALPALAYGALIHRRTFARVDVLGVVCMGLALWLIVSADFRSITEEYEDPDDFSARYMQESSEIGLVLVSIALLLEVVIGSVQERMTATLSVEHDELILYTHAVGTAFLGAIALVTGELAEGMMMTFDHPSMVLIFMTLSTTGYYGVTVLKVLTKHCGSLPALLTTSTRKALALVLSVYVFPKSWDARHTGGAILFIAGTLLSSSASKMKLRRWLGDSAVGRALQLDGRNARSLRSREAAKERVSR